MTSNSEPVNSGDQNRIDQLWPLSSSELTADLLGSLDDQEFKELCRRIRKREIKPNGDSRFADSVIRDLTLRRRPKKRITIPIKVLASRRNDQSVLLNGLYGKRLQTWVAPINRSKSESIKVSDFCLFTRPNEVIKKLNEIAIAETQAVTAKIFLDDAECGDIGSYLALALIVKDAIPFISDWFGQFGTVKVLKATKLSSAMQIRVPKDLDTSNIWAFPVCRRRTAGSSKSTDVALQQSTKEKVADELVHAVGQWLAKSQPSLALTVEAKAHFQKLIGEVLDNAERHSHVSGDGDWAVTGYMRREESVEGLSAKITCFLAFASVGFTIAESIQNGDLTTREQVNAYINRHRSVNPNQSPDTLATVVALQDGLSRVPQEPEDPIGGLGLMDFAEFVSKLSNTADPLFEPQIAIISGKTCVHLRTPYAAGIKETKGARRFQWFNSDNSFTIPPDNIHVFDLDECYQGALISCRFQIDDSAFEGA